MKKFAYLAFAMLMAALVGCQSAPSAPAAASSGPADMTGTWAFQVDTSAGTGFPTFIIKQTGNKLSGTYSGAFGESTIDGDVQGNKFTIKFESGGVTSTYTGTVENNNRVKGEVDFGGSYGKGTFRGQKRS